MRRIFVLMLFVLLLTISGGVLAQDSTTVFCGDLAQADCDLLIQAQAAMQSVSSGTASFNVNFNLTGIPDEPENISISITGTAAFAGAEGFHAFKDMSPDPAELNFGAILPDLLTALETFSGEISLVVNIPPGLDEDIPSEIALNLRMVNGVGYIDFDALQPITNDPSMTGWGGLDFINLLRDLLAQQPDLFDELTEMSAMSMGGMDPAAIQHFSDPAFVERFLTIERVADEDGYAVFETSVNFTAMLSDPEFQQMMREQMIQQAAMQGETMTPEEIEMAMSISTQVVQDATFTGREVIDPATGYVRSTSFSMVMDMTRMAGLIEEQGESMEAAPIFIFDFSISLDNLNSTPATEAPENAAVFPYRMLLGMIEDMEEMPAVEVTPEVGD